MRYPLALELKSSRGIEASVFAMHGIAALALFLGHQAGAWLLQSAFGVAVCGAVLLGSGWHALHGERGKHGLKIHLLGDGGITVGRGSQADHHFRVAGQAVDFGWVAWLRLESVAPSGSPAGGMRLMLVPANLAPGQWRLFRLWLKHRAAVGVLSP
ncbi:protein YgfX [Azoarcus olearius]|uniref:Conserved hypothetical membrane protein n=1 Tax=Azoarcus sp. (strain BH72) TaxID=418699 RepID=A1K5Z0_AZOSB|nr:protein YgfX [Azoarcus olearius]CAL94245.1 conserved hypothetical membrane protein [Azoarcus olearius]